MHAYAVHRSYSVLFNIEYNILLDVTAEYSVSLYINVVLLLCHVDRCYVMFTDATVLYKLSRHVC